MKARVIRSILIFLAAAILFTGGVTSAWFIDTATPEPATMVAGTVKLNVLPAQVTPVPQDPQQITWQPGTNKTFCWSLKNTGSKKIMLRARPLLERETKGETAWAEGAPFNPDGQGNWAMYFTYNVGSGKKSVRLLAGQHEYCGDLIVQTINNSLHVTYQLKQGYALLASHLAVTANFADIPTVANGNPPPGQFPFKKEHNAVQEYTYIIPLSGTYPAGHLKGQSYSWGNGQELYLAAHSDVLVPNSGSAKNISWQLATQSSAGWQKGEPETVDGKTVTWWYYCQPVPANNEIKLCLTGYLAEKAASGTYQIHLEAEAVQASHDAIDIWPHPCK
ncbi:MAG TPA: hypothetical protein VFC74_03025 [Oscillospiraceae bacterium]|nr:hypothetical protein [Oscillospiraceae bacterium]